MKLFSCSDSAAVEAKKVINNYNRKKIDRGFPCIHTIQKVREQKGGTLNYRPNQWALIQGRAFTGVWAVN